MSTQVRTSKHTTKFANKGKHVVLRDFLSDYANAVRFYIDYAWTNRIDVGSFVFDVSAGEYNCPKFITTVGNVPPDTNLSARALKCASGQALGIVSSVVNKIKKLQFKIQVAESKGYAPIKLYQDLESFQLTRPKIGRTVQANLNSLCIEYSKNESGEFDGFLILKSIGKSYGHIRLPIKNHRHIKTLISKGFAPKTSWMISEGTVSSLWERPTPEKKKDGIKVGADQGFKTCISLSDGQTTGTDPHGHTLESIIQGMVACVKGSKGYNRKRIQRTNYINWSINQLNFDEISEIGYEDVKNIRKGKNSSALMKGWTYTQIAAKIEDRCESEGVLLTKQGSIYRSQRCYLCGFVHDKNRKGKLFECLHCRHTDDADMNGAKNHSINIDPIPFDVMRLKLNKNGFFWKEDGLFNLVGEVLTVPHINKKLIS